MNKIIPYIVLALSVLILLGQNVNDLVHLIGLLILSWAALHVMIKRRLPSGFWGNMALLLLGPSILVFLTMYIYRFLSENSQSSWLALIILALFGMLGWMGRRQWQNHFSRDKDRFQNQSNEREFSVPMGRSDDSNHGDEL